MVASNGDLFYSCNIKPGYTGCQATNGGTFCFCDFEDEYDTKNWFWVDYLHNQFSSCNQSIDYIKKNSGPQRKCYSGSNGMYELESCGPVDDYVCTKQSDGNEVGKRCFPRSSLQGQADGSCSKQEGYLSCYCDTDG